MAMLRGRVCALLAFAIFATTAYAEEGESETSRGVNMSISIMLLGAISFMMALFYITNHHDPDLRKIAWSVLSDTISIFSAVLFFQAFAGVVQARITDAFHLSEMTVGIFHMLFWYVMLQLALAVITGAIGGKKVSSVDDPDAEEKEVQKVHLEEMELNLKCFAILLGHITGFAFIGGFGNVQQLFKTSDNFLGVDSVIGVFGTVLFMLCIVLAIYQLVDFVRGKYTMADGHETEEEIKWDEETEETENDVLGLCVSFLTIQGIRKVIRGDLPNAEGELGGVPDYLHSITLTFVGIFFAFSIMLLVFVKSLNKYPRVKAQLSNILSMCFSWSFLFSVSMIITKMGLTGLLGGVVLALVITILAFTMIFVVAKIKDAKLSSDEETEKDLDKGLKHIMMSAGILVGFTWERAFDSAVEVIVDNNPYDWLPQDVLKLVMATCLCTLVVPAWKIYILPQIILAEEEEEKEEELEALGDKAQVSKKEQARKRAEMEKHHMKASKEHVEEKLYKLEEHLQMIKSHKVTTKSKTDELQNLEMRNHELETAVDRFGDEILHLEALVTKHAGHKGLPR